MVFYEAPLGYNNVDCFIIEVLKLENRTAFYFKNSQKNINMTEEDEKHYGNRNICRFCEKNVESDKVRDHCHLTANH